MVKLVIPPGLGSLLDPRLQFAAKPPNAAIGQLDLSWHGWIKLRTFGILFCIKNRALESGNYQRLLQSCDLQFAHLF